MKKYLFVCVDTNDGDNLESLTPISDEDIDALLPLMAAIEQFKPYQATVRGMSMTHRHNFPYGEVLREDLGERSVDELYGMEHKDALQLFQDNYLPYSEYGCHTIESVRVLTIAEDVRIL